MINTAIHHYRCTIWGHLLSELTVGFLLALPLCGALSQMEKRLVVHRRIHPSLVTCRIFWWPFIFSSVEKLMLEPLVLLFAKTCSFEVSLQVAPSLIVMTIRTTLMFTGLYLGQSFFPLALTGSIATGTM